VNGNSYVQAAGFIVNWITITLDQVPIILEWAQTHRNGAMSYTKPVSINAGERAPEKDSMLRCDQPISRQCTQRVHLRASIFARLVALLKEKFP